MGLAPSLVTLFYLIHVFKGPTSKYSHILGIWGLGLQYMNLVETQLRV